MATFTTEQIQAQRDRAAYIARGGPAGPCFAHIGFLRFAPPVKPGPLSLRCYPTSDLIREEYEDDGALWESIEAVRVA